MCSIYVCFNCHIFLFLCRNLHFYKMKDECMNWGRVHLYFVHIIVIFYPFDHFQKRRQILQVRSNWYSLRPHQHHGKNKKKIKNSEFVRITNLCTHLIYMFCKLSKGETVGLCHNFFVCLTRFVIYIFIEFNNFLELRYVQVQKI